LWFSKLLDLLINDKLEIKIPLWLTNNIRLGMRPSVRWRGYRQIWLNIPRRTLQLVSCTNARLAVRVPYPPEQVDETRIEESGREWRWVTRQRWMALNYAVTSLLLQDLRWIQQKYRKWLVYFLSWFLQKFSTFFGWW
jgi:hypothetical protein